MPSRLFRVDMSDSSRDYMAVATEPGLAMLDAQRVNYGILFKWLREHVAEPELQGPQLVSFYLREEERGRLENVVCVPATRKDLQGPLKQDCEAIETAIRKVKPESATEQVLLRIISKTFKELTVDPETSDFPHYFFKCRAAAEPWRLVWCWGYQRKDLEPAKPVICSNMDCHQLFAHKPKTKRQCPACAVVVKKQKSALASAFSPMYLLLLLALLLGLFLFFNQPKLVVTPNDWSGPRGSRAKFQVVDQRWYFFTDDVTNKAVPQSHDTHIIAFKYGAEGRAKNEGRTFVTFRYGSLQSDITVKVGPPIPPETLAIEPEEVMLGVDTTERIRVVGTYKDGDSLDLTDDATIKVADEAIAYASEGRIYGVSVGKTKLTATYQATEEDEVQTAEAVVEVTDIQYAKLEVALEPSELSVGQTGKLMISGVTDDGRKFDLIGSKKLQMVIEPSDVVRRDFEFLIGQKSGKAKVTATVGELNESLEFTVGDSLLAGGTFEVLPREVKLPLGSYRDLDVVSANTADIETSSSDAEVAVVSSPDPFLHRLTAYKEGTTKITFKQGGQEQVVDVTVVPNDVQSVRIEPALITAYVAEQLPVAIVGERADGTTVDIAPDQFEVLQQPRSEYAEFDRVGLTVFGILPTVEDDKLVIQYGDLPPAEATIRVVRRSEIDVAELFVPHPPIGVRPGMIGGPIAIAGGGFLGDGLVFKPGVGLVMGDTVPPGLINSGIRSGGVISRIGDIDLTTIRDPNLISQYVAGLGPQSVISMVGPGGDLIDIALARASLTAFEDVHLNDAQARDVTATDFGAELSFSFREAAEYRITDAAGIPLSEYQPFEAGAVANINTSKIARVQGKNKYRIYVERKSGDAVEKFPFSIELESGN